MTADQNKEISYIAYNHANMPTFVRMRRGGIKFVYDALGNKWYKFSKDGAMDEAKGTAYIFGMQYEFKENNHIKYDWKLMFIGTDEGYVSAVYPEGIDSGFKFQYVYNHTDHLGNIRQNITHENGRLTVLREHNYYPFGLLHSGYNEDKEDLKYDKEQDFIFTVQAQAGRYKYKFQGQERQEDLNLGWDSFKFRNYDYAIGRFFNVDPLAEKFPYMTVYQFAGNKPVWSNEIEGLESGVDVWMRVRDEEILNNMNSSANTSNTTTSANTSNTTTSTNNSSTSQEENIETINLDPITITSDTTSVNTSDNTCEEQCTDNCTETIEPQANTTNFAIRPEDYGLFSRNNIQNQSPVMIKQRTDADEILGNYYSYLYGQEMREREFQIGFYLHEPVMSGYYGGANQYPVISSALMGFGSPESLLFEGAASSIGMGANAYRASRSWRAITRLTGEGMTLTKKAEIYRNSIRTYNTMLKAQNAVLNVSGAYGTYSTLRSSYIYYNDSTNNSN